MIRYYPQFNVGDKVKPRSQNGSTYNGIVKLLYFELGEFYYVISPDDTNIQNQIENGEYTLIECCVVRITN